MICDGAKWDKGTPYKPEDVCINSLRAEINPYPMNLTKSLLSERPWTQRSAPCVIPEQFQSNMLVWRSAMTLKSSVFGGEPTERQWGKPALGWKVLHKLDLGGSHMSGYTEKIY